MADAVVSGADQEKLVSYLDGTGLTVPGTLQGNKGEFTTLECGGEGGIDHEATIAGGIVLKFKGGLLYEVEVP